MSELEKLKSQIEAVHARRKRRAEQDAKDRDELFRLESAIKRASAKTMLGQTVVLNPKISIQKTELRKLRGMTAVVNSVGRKYVHVTFRYGQSWRIGFDRVVPATAENTADESGELTDSVADSLNAAFAR